MLSLSVIKEHVGQVQTEYPVGSVNVKGISSDGSHILAATFLPSAASCAPISLTQHMENPTQPSETTVINLPSKPSLLLLLNHTGGEKKPLSIHTPRTLVGSQVWCGIQIRFNGVRVRFICSLRACDWTRFLFALMSRLKHDESALCFKGSGRSFQTDLIWFLFIVS